MMVNDLVEIKMEIMKIVSSKAKTVSQAKEFLSAFTGKPIENPRVFVENLTVDNATELLIRIRNEVEETQENESNLLPIPTGAPSGELAVIDEGSMEKVMKLMDKIHELAMKKIRSFTPDHFVIFGKNVCLVGKGIDKFLSGLPLPLEIKNIIEMQIEYREDKEGDRYPVYRYSGDAVNAWTKMSIPVYSEVWAGEGFYTARYDNGKKTKLLSNQVNLRDVRIAAHRGLRKEAVKLFFGLRGMSKEEAKGLGIPIDRIIVAKE